MNNKLIFRTGIGYDVHPIVKGRRLFLGGVEIESEFGLDGHSDSDVLIHSICDSLLGALSLGDIGAHFPNTDPRYKNISSLVLLEKVSELIHEKKFKIENIDSTIIAEQPKLLPYIELMREKIASVLRISKEQVSIKATTNEKLGFVGRKEGIASISISLLSSEINESI